MFTVFDFMTQVKGIEYLIAVSAIFVFILFVEILKPRPFSSMIETAKEDLRQIGRNGGQAGVLRTAGHVAAAPFLALAYIVSLPFVFFFAVNLVLVENLARAVDATAVWMARMIISNIHALARAFSASASFGWRPQEAYLIGSKGRGNRKTAGQTEEI
jgi:hypothetical protein